MVGFNFVSKNDNFKNILLFVVLPLQKIPFVSFLSIRNIAFKVQS